MRKSFATSVLETGFRVVGRVAGTVLADPRGQEAMARAVGLAQTGLRLFEAVQEQALHAAGLAARPDYDEVRKQVARLKRKAREVSQQLDRASGPAGLDDREDEGGSR